MVEIHQQSKKDNVDISLRLMKLECALREIIDLYENPLGVVINGAEMGQIAKRALEDKDSNNIPNLLSRYNMLYEAAKNASTWMEHAKIFITSKEKMHPDRQFLFNDAQAELVQLLEEK